MIECSVFSLVEHAINGRACLYRVGADERKAEVAAYLSRLALSRKVRVDTVGHDDKLAIGGNGGSIWLVTEGAALPDVSFSVRNSADANGRRP